MNRTLIIVLSIAGSLRTVGLLLQHQDTNNTGNDDLIGSVCVTAADALSAYGASNETGLRRALTSLRDALNAYLGPAQPAS